MDIEQPQDCWAVSLKGHEIDLKAWSSQFQPPHDPIVVYKPDGETLLFSDNFEGLSTPSEVREMAISLLPILNGIMALDANCEPIEFEGVSQFEADGNQLRHRFLSASADIRFGGSAILSGTATVTSFGLDGLPVPPPPPAPTRAQKLVKLAEGKPKIAAMLEQLSKADTWGEIYKAFERAESICGDERKLKALFGPDGPKYKRARATANYHRHADEYCPDPPTPLGAAKSLAREAVMLALKKTQSL